MLRRVLILGAGNLLLGDEGFGVHFVRHLATHWNLPPDVRLLDGGTLGLMLAHEFEWAERVYLVDTVAADGRPGEVRRYDKGAFMRHDLPLKLSPHQAGLQELMLVSELRGLCPPEVFLLGVLPESLEPSVDLSPSVRRALEELAAMLVRDLQALGLPLTPRVMSC